VATVYIAEFPEINVSQGNITPIVVGTPLVEQTVAIGAEAKSAAFNAKTQIVRIHADAICSIMFGNNPTATTTKMRLVAGQTEYFRVNPTDKVSVISNT
jgi:hypothetical protein